MISWKRSLWTLNEEYEVAKKKKLALDNLLCTGRISESTHEMFTMEIAEAIDEIESRQKTLLQKMNVKIVELGDQVKTLEILLADFEIQHITGEIDEETYQREINVLSMGLETSRLELNSIKEAADQWVNGNMFPKQVDEQQTSEVIMEPEKLQKPTIELEASETNETPSKEAEVQGVNAAVTTEQPVEAKENQETS